MRRRAFGTVIRRKGKPGFHAAFVWEGKRYWRAAGPTREVAAQNLVKIHALLMSGRSVADGLAEVLGEVGGSRRSFRDAAPLYLEYAKARKKASTWESDLRRMRVLLDAPWAAKHLGHIDAGDITRWVHERTKDGASGATLNRDCSLASALFKWAIRMGYVDENPFRRVQRFSERGRAREVYLTPDESRALLGVASPPLFSILVCALSTGMRRGELLSLEWRDVDFGRREILVRPENEKAGRGRVIPMTADLHANLGRLRSEQQVLSITGTSRVFAISAPILRRLFESAVERCVGIPLEKRSHVTFHTLRHTAASLMVAAGVPLFDVAKILGHSTLAVTMRYAHFAPEAGRSAIDALGKKLAIEGTHTPPRTASGTSDREAGWSPTQ